MFYVFGISVSFFLSVLLFLKKKKIFADLILASWLLVIGLHLTTFYLFSSGIIYRYPYLLGLDIPLPLIHGPFLLIYIMALTKQFPKRKWRLLLHFLPLLSCYALFMPFYLLSTDLKIQVFRMKGAGWEKELFVNYTLVYGSGIVYAVWGLLLLRKHRRNILHQFSNTENINLNWLTYLIVGIGCIWLVTFTTSDTFTYGTVVLFVLFIGLYGMRQVGIFSSAIPTHAYTISSYHQNTLLQNTIPETETTSSSAIPKDPVNSINSSVVSVPLLTEEYTDPDATKKKYQKSGLRNEDIPLIHQQLSQLIHNEQLFKDPELTLTDLSARLNIHPNHLSQVVNSIEQKNFYDFINDLRVEAFKQSLQHEQNKKYTLLSLAMDCGFNSKTSFNRNFKRVTGLSPSEYLKHLHSESSKEMR